MTEVPGSDWIAGHDDEAALAQAPRLQGISCWQRKVGAVTHVFTHFPLELVVYTARVERRTGPPRGMRWAPIATLGEEALPNLMRKVIAHALDL
jgi:A/G-specific adenine glycosylase